MPAPFISGRRRYKRRQSHGPEKRRIRRLSGPQDLSRYPEMGSGHSGRAGGHPGGVLVFGQRYLVFRDQGVRLELPFLHQKDGQQSGPGDVSLEVRPQGDQSGEDQSAQKPGADETEALRAVELPLSAVQDGTALFQLEQAGPTP